MYRGFRTPITLDLSHPRDYTFNSSNITNGVITNALVIGPNASGKTNLLSAIADIRSNYHQPEGPLAMGDFDETFINADSDSKSAIFDYEFLFNAVKVEYHYEKGSDRRIMRETLSFDRSVIFDCDSEGRLIDSNLEAIGAKSLNWSFAGGYSSALAYISSNAPVQKDSVLGQMRSFTQSIAMAIHDGWGSSRTLARYLQQIIARGLVGDLEKFLNDFGIDEKLVVREEGDGSRAVYCSRVRPIPFARCLSSGTRTLVSLFYIYKVLSRGTLYLLDEFDAYCHFELAEKLMRYFGTESGRQTISTTHNTSLTRNDVMRPDCIFKFGEDGSLAALSERTPRELRFGNNVERLLRNGEFD
jgi:hypothetical protein